jgi:hypothetical protein
MKKRFLNLLVAVIVTAGLQAQKSADTPVPGYDDNRSLTWEEAIMFYKDLDERYEEATFIEMGMTDAGQPLHLFIISSDGESDPAAIHNQGKAIVLINNGIHPGEPEGIDASARFAADLLSNKDGMRKYLRNCSVAIIPVYNIGGALARSRYWRINQNGPEEKGARRNSRFLDLNRDFVKQDSRDARAFAEIYRFLDPDVFLDTHTTNGSDHQFTVTLIATQPEKMHPEMEDFFRNDMLKELYSRMKEAHSNEMVPYVQYTERGEIKAIIGFEEDAYYSTGYSALFNSFGFMTETLVYKPYQERVEGTRQFITELVRYTSLNHKEILRHRAEANRRALEAKEFVIDREQDTTRWDLIEYHGYRYEESTTPITGRKSGFYNHDKPYTDTIRYYNYFNPSISVTVPEAYIVPFAWEEVIERLAINGVEMKQLQSDTTLMVETYYVDSFEPARRATQGHYFNSKVKLRTVTQEVEFFKGDYIVPVKQRSKKYILTMLEPQSESGFFAWNFFDSFLEGQDWYSVWGFESHLKELLDHDPALREAFEKAKREDSAVASDPVAQLQWLYQHTPASELEKRTRLYPVGRIMNAETLLKSGN